MESISHVEAMDEHDQRSRQDYLGNSVLFDEETYKVLLKSLLFDRINFRVNNVKRALLSTCQWLLRHQDFQAWYENLSSDHHSGFLWIRGKPGCGKSTLMKTALEWARKRKDKGQIIVPYFFHARASASLEKSSMGLYRTVVYQLLGARPGLRSMFTERFALKGPGDLGESWTVEELQDFLYDAVESDDSLNLCLFIDALDEAEYEDDVREMISFLTEFSDRASAQDGFRRLKVCLSSRHYPHVTIGRGRSLIVEEQPEHNHDIDSYITRELNCLDGSEKDDLRVTILSKSAHVFLWVVLVVRILNKLNDQGATLPVMIARLATIPADLDQLFREILTKSDDEIEKSIFLFQWMLFRMRPLEPAELFLAIEYSKPPTSSSWPVTEEISVPDSDRLARFILDCSRGLVEIAEASASQAPVVQFIHETVREFLLERNGLKSLIPAMATDLHGISHEILRAACLRRISTTPFLKEYEHFCDAYYRRNEKYDRFMAKMRSDLPLLDYAILHLFDHAEQAQNHGYPQQALLSTYIDAEAVCWNSYRLWWNVLERYRSRKIPSEGTLINVLVNRKCLSLLLVSSKILSSTAIAGQGGAELVHFILAWGSLESVQLLLDKGAYVNVVREGLTTLQAVLIRRQFDRLQILIDAGADVNDTAAESDQAPLQMAIIQRCGLAVVKAILNAGADVHVRSGDDKMTILQVAIRPGDFDIVKALIDAGADVNAQGGRYGNALQAASYDGNKKIVQMLLDAGAAVNAQGGYYGNALQAASYNGHGKIAQMLLAAGANVNAQGGQYGNALQATSYWGYEKIAQMLLDAGADVNARGGQHRSALKAARNGYRGPHEQVMQLLLKHGAES